MLLLRLIIYIISSNGVLDILYNNTIKWNNPSGYWHVSMVMLKHLMTIWSKFFLKTNILIYNKDPLPYLPYLETHF